MQMIRRPSRQAMDQATRLGATMARTERALRPDVTNADRYGTYALFAEAHRRALERVPAFAKWEERISTLIEQEAVHAGYPVVGRDSCDAFAKHFATPLRCSFWYGWEQAVGLKQLYDAQHSDVDEGVRVLRVAHMGRSVDRPGADERSWKNQTPSGLLDLADRAYDDLSVRPEDLGNGFQPRPGA